MPETESTSAPTAQERVDASTQATVDVVVGEMAIQRMRPRSNAVDSGTSSSPTPSSSSDPYGLRPVIAMTEKLAAQDKLERDYADRAKHGVTTAQSRVDADNALTRHNYIEKAKGLAIKAVVHVADTAGAPLTAGQLNMGSAVQAGYVLHQKHHQNAALELTKGMENSTPEMNEAADYFIGKNGGKVVGVVASVNPIASNVHTAIGAVQRIADKVQGRPPSMTETYVSTIHNHLIRNHPQAMAISTALLGNSPADLATIQNIKTAQSEAGLNALKGAASK